MNFTAIDYVLIFVLIVYLVLGAQVAFIDGPKHYRKSLAVPMDQTGQFDLAHLLYSTWWRCLLTGIFWFPVAVVSAIWLFGFVIPRYRRRAGKEG